MRERAEPDCSAPRLSAEAVLQRAWLPPSAASLTALASHPTPATWLDSSATTPAPFCSCSAGPTTGRAPPFCSGCSTPPSSTKRCACWNGPAKTPSIGTPPSCGPFTRPPSPWRPWPETPPFRPPTAIRTRRGRAACWRRWAGSASAPRTPPPRPPAWPTRNCYEIPLKLSAAAGDWISPRWPAVWRRRWRLPDWLTAVVGCLRLPPELAHYFGPDPALFALRAGGPSNRPREQGVDLGLGIAGRLAPRVGRADSRSEWPTIRPSKVWESPYRSPLLRDLLATAAENRRLREAAHGVRLETEVDRLHEALEEQASGEDGRLKAGKLGALAEFAAGAGHEINNPLAVISGQAQYLLAHAADWFAATRPSGRARRCTRSSPRRSASTACCAT